MVGGGDEREETREREREGQWERKVGDKDRYRDERNKEQSKWLKERDRE